MADENWEDEIIRVLLTRFDGRAKFTKVKNILHHRNLVGGIGIGEVLKRMSDSSRFLVFQKNQSVKYISVFCQDANICFAFRRRGYEKCRNSNCSKFHVCKYFISGNCTNSFNCRFGHDLLNETNRKVSERLGLSFFSADEVHTIISRSHPAVCVEYNTGGCGDDDCPDLHVCSRFMLQKCTAGAVCRLRHSLLTSEHNKWVLDTFNVSHLTEEELRRIIPVRGIVGADGELQPQMTPATSSLSLLSSSTSTSSTSLAEEDTDEYVTRVFRYLLLGLGGRAQFDTFLTERRRHLQFMRRANIIGWLKDHMDRFILFERAGEVKYVSVYCRQARVCFRYNSSGCNNQSCKFFHICKRFVAGNCVHTSCPLSHSFSTGTNAKAYSDLMLDHFTTNEIRKIFVYSSPAVCEAHNRSGCFYEGCTDLHVCAKDLLCLCTSGVDCKFGHMIRDSGEHNSKVLKTFRVDMWHENNLRKLAIIKGDYLGTQEGTTTPSTRVSSSGRQLQDNKSLELQTLVSVKADTVPRKYEYICEAFTWTGACPNSSHCPRYHNPDRLPYLWLVVEDEEWFRVPASISMDLETCFCDLGDVLNKKFAVRGIEHVDFNAMSAISEGTTFKLKRLSTPSYVSATPGTPLNFYTQWVWYRQERNGTYPPFYPGSLQYTLEEKYLKGQHKYYFEFEDLRLMVDTHSLPMTQTNLDTQTCTRICRRPVFEPTKKSEVLKMSSLLLAEFPSSALHQVPRHWSALDHFQDFELVELQSADPEYITVQRHFFSTMSINEQTIVHVFRVQNPGLWDKYCSAKRAMTPRGQRPEEVEERQLFHGTPTLQAARGICANSFDFRRSGENVGAIHGKGAYFSTTAKYSHSYTRAHTPGDPLRFMFLGRILVGQYTLGHPSYTKPPERDRLKMYDSCVNDVSNPTIFVIFDLAQSYPEYLIQYTDVVGKKQQSQVHTSASVPSLAQTQPSLNPLSRQSSLKMSPVPPSTGNNKLTWTNVVSTPSSVFPLPGTSATVSTRITSTSSSVGSISTVLSPSFTTSTGSNHFATSTGRHSLSTAVTSASESKKSFSTSTSSGSLPTSASTGPLTTSTSTGLLPTTSSSRPLPASTSTGPLTTSTSTGLLPTTSSSRPLPASTSTGPLTTSTSSGPLTPSTSSGPLTPSTSTGPLPFSTSSGPLTTSTSTGILSISTSSGPLATTSSSRLLPFSTSSGPLTTSTSTVPLPTTSSSRALPASTSTGPLTTSTYTGPLTTSTSTGSLSTTSSSRPLPASTSTGPLTTSASTGSLPTTSSSRPLPASTSTGILSISTSSGPLPTTSSSRLLPASTSTGPLPFSTSSGPLTTSTGPLPTTSSSRPLPGSTFTGPLPISTSSGPLPTTSSSRSLPVYTSTGPLTTSSSTGPLTISTSTGPLTTSASTGLLTISTSTGPLTTSASTGLLPTTSSSRPLPTFTFTEHLPIFTSSGPFLSTTSGPLTTFTPTGSSRSSAQQPSSTVPALQPTMTPAGQLPTAGPLHQPSAVAPVQTASPTAHRPYTVGPATYQPSTRVSRSANTSSTLAPVQPVSHLSTTSPSVHPRSRSPQLTSTQCASGRTPQTLLSSPYMGDPSVLLHLSLNDDPTSFSALDTFTNVSLSTWQDQSLSPVRKPKDKDRCVIA